VTSWEALDPSPSKPPYRFVPEPACSKLSPRFKPPPGVTQNLEPSAACSACNRSTRCARPRSRTRATGRAPLGMSSFIAAGSESASRSHFSRGGSSSHGRRRLQTPVRPPLASLNTWASMRFAQRRRPLELRARRTSRRGRVAAFWSSRVRVARRGFPRGPDPKSVYPEGVYEDYHDSLSRSVVLDLACRGSTFVLPSSCLEPAAERHRAELGWF
jgi:hypothetical protein